MLTRSIPQSGTGDQTVRRSTDPATDGLTDRIVRRSTDPATDGLMDRMVRRLTDSSALRPTYSLQLDPAGQDRSCGRLSKPALTGFR
jgi:hypothetical protein